MRGELQSLADETPLLVTVHPSYLLRIEDEDQKAAEYRRFVGDLRLARKFLAAGAA
jgi:DNA polymerase